jgi:dTDP-4-dehydrorhamnose 3,5-epimerase
MHSSPSQQSGSRETAMTNAIDRPSAIGCLGIRVSAHSQAEGARSDIKQIAREDTLPTGRQNVTVPLPTIRCEIPDPAMPEIKVLTPRRFGDDRGFFSEVYNAAEMRSLGIGIPFVQDNHSRSAAVGTVRGLHYQAPPFAQDKLVRVTCGAILDVGVDIRHSSPTFGRWAAVVISAESWNQLLIPVGFAHGFCTLEPNTSLVQGDEFLFSRP